MIRSFKDFQPEIHPSCYLEESAQVIGEVFLAEDTSVWCGAVLRGDVGPLRFGPRTNIQDNCTIHCTRGLSVTTVGADVTVGHGAILHGCTIEDRVLIGMGAIVLDNAHIPSDCLVGAGALVTLDQRFEPGQLIIGRPARAVRDLTEEERASLLASAQHYVQYVKEHRASGYAGSPGTHHLRFEVG